MEMRLKVLQIHEVILLEFDHTVIQMMISSGMLMEVEIEQHLNKHYMIVHSRMLIH